MYELKRLQPKFEIPLPNCMYAMRNINLVFGATHTTGNTSLNGEEVQTVCGFGDNEHNARISVKYKTSNICQTFSNKCALDLDLLGIQIQHLIKSEAAAVVKRQEKILQQLNELREQLTKMRSSLNLKGNVEEITEKPRSREKNEISENVVLKEEPLHDIVINAHPNFIPYSLLALKNAWKNVFNIAIKTFTHSSLPNTDPAVLEFEQKLGQIPNDPTKSTIKITLIWKNCENTEMITSPSMYVPICGEVNIIRYLSRIGPSSYRYENSSLCNDIDSVLDICYRLLRCKSVESRRRMLQLLNDRLQNQTYFGGNDMSMADIGVWSSIKRIPNCRGKELTPTLREWHKRAQLATMI